MTVTVISKDPPGGRCTLYTRYAEALSRHSGLPVNIHYPGDKPGDGIAPPALVIRGKLVTPADGVIVSPDDITQTAGGAWASPWIWLPANQNSKPFRIGSWRK